MSSVNYLHSDRLDLIGLIIDNSRLSILETLDSYSELLTFDDFELKEMLYSALYPEYQFIVDEEDNSLSAVLEGYNGYNLPALPPEVISLKISSSYVGNYSSLPVGLKTLIFEDLNDQPDFNQFPDSIESLFFESCSGLVTLDNLSSNLKKLSLHKCNYLVSLVGISSLDTLKISHCDSISTLFGLTNDINELILTDIKQEINLENLPKNLKVLELTRLRSLRSFVLNGLILDKLSIIECKELIDLDLSMESSFVECLNLQGLKRLKAKNIQFNHDLAKLYLTRMQFQDVDLTGLNWLDEFFTFESSVAHVTLPDLKLLCMFSTKISNLNLSLENVDDITIKFCNFVSESDKNQFAKYLTV